MNTRHTLRFLRTFVLAALTTVAMAACSDDNADPDGSEPITPGTPDGIPVAFSADINPDSDDASAHDGNPSSRTVLTDDGNGGFTVAWKGKDHPSNPDKINIWARTDDTWANSGSHKVYIPSTSTESSALEPMDEQNKLTIPSVGEWTFTAVYGSSSCTSQECRVNIESQTQSERDDFSHIADKDFSVATATQTVEANGDMPQQIGLRFKHKLSALQLNITNNTGLDIKVQKIRLSVDKGQITTKRNYDVKTGGWDATKDVTEDNQELTVSSPATAGTKAQAFYMLLFPGYAGKTMTITVITHRGEYTLTKVAPADGFKEGTNYTTNITVKSSDLSEKETWTEIINNVAQLQDFRNRVNSGNSYKGQTVKIADGVRELNLSNEKESWTPIGNNKNPFRGTFDGNGCHITGLNVNTDATYAGLFGYIVSATVKNLHVSGSVSGKDYIGGIVGYCDSNCTIENCIYSGSVTGEGSVGGIAGVGSGAITGCYTTGSVEASSGEYTGGIVGVIASGTIERCYSMSDVTGAEDVGGIVGMNMGATIAQCYATGTISATGSNSAAGGIVGNNNVYVENTVTNCIALNDSVKSTKSGGKVFGYNNNSMAGCAGYVYITVESEIPPAIDGELGNDTIYPGEWKEMDTYTSRGFTTENGWAFDTSWKYLPWNKAFETFPDITYSDYKIPLPTHLK